ncbi:MAG: AraC family transcriptional regulator, partial [Muribaculaceae bacterium]|nr:AraC family transcriptional regulator [Muribaculaceae bacterium]
TDTNISIKSVAEALGTNRTYLSNAINHVFNKSFPQVLAEYRVRAAIDILNDRDCDLPLKAIAAEVGFSSASVFFTTFRNIMGMTPTAYRNSLDR